MVDSDLLRRYVETGSDEAFAELVKRYVDLVYSISLRQVGDRHLAEEVTQTVFIILARKAGSLSRRVILAGWLCRTARYASAKALTSLRRRQQRHEQAHMQNPSPASAETDFWSEMEPILDSALSQLSQKDHDALAVRFLQGRSFKEAAAALGTSEAGAKMRVNRALERLRAIFARRGVHVTSAALMAAISTHAVQAAPPGLAASATIAALAGTKLSTSTLSLVSSTLKFMAIKKTTSTALVIVALLAAGTGGVFLQHKFSRMQAASVSGHEQPRYTTPEATLHSLIDALRLADVARFAEGCTPEFAEIVRTECAGKTPEQIRHQAEQKAREFSSLKILGQQEVSPGERRLLVAPTGEVPRGRPGTRQTVMRMRKLGNDWKFDGTAQ